jgi:DNA polymerase-3 subunit gamma/tau
MSFYRKWRPNSFNQVIGQNVAVSTLQSISKTENIPHAYIFCGGHGTGKTTLARLFAKELNTDPADIYELDAASNRGIDEARDLREAIHTLPVLSKYKVYILDEAHMLTKEASNALLKTLEEPPRHVVFILCTTDPEKLLPTIRSRSQIINFKTADKSDLIKQLSIVAKGEGMEIDSESLDLIASKSNRSYRDALSNLETIYHAFGNKVTIDNLKSFFKLSDREVILKVLEATYSKDLKALFSVLEDGEIGAGFYDELLDLIREGMMVRQKVNNDFDLEFSDFVMAHETLFTSKNLLFLLEKKPVFEYSKNKSAALMAALGALAEN